MSLCWFPPTTNVAVVPCEPNFLEIDFFASVFVYCLVIETQRWLELESSFVTGDCVADVSCCWCGHVAIALAEKRNFELSNGVAVTCQFILKYTCFVHMAPRTAFGEHLHTVEQAKKMNIDMRFAECSLELFHECLCLLVFLGLGIIASAPLKVGEGLPGKVYHFLVSTTE